MRRLALLPLLLSLASAAPAPDTAWTLLSPDGGWNWFSGPRAVTQGDRLYAGWISAIGSVQVGALDERLGLTQQYTLAERFEKDDHAAPALLTLPDGRLMTIYARHDKDDLHVRTTTRPGDITRWTPDRALGFLPAGHKGKGLTFQNAARLAAESNTLYLCWRGFDGKPAFSRSRDLGTTWERPRTLVRRPEAPDDHRPYLKMSDDGQSRIDLVFTDGHPAAETSNGLYYVRYEKNAFWKADGTKIGALDDLPLDPARCDRVYAGAAGRAWIWDVASDRDGRPVIAYTRLPAPDDHRYAYARWDGQAWQNHEITSAGRAFPADDRTPPREPFYSGGLALDPADPATVVLARPLDGRFELERWRTADGGTRWTHEPVTAASTRDNVRPVFARGATGAAARLLWMNPRAYKHYTDFDSTILVDRPSPTPRHISSQLAPGALRATLEAVADWQLAHPGRYRTTDWTQAALYTGMMALSGLSPDPRYREAMRLVGEQNEWKPGPRQYHADDHCVGQTYVELYELYREEPMLVPLRELCDAILASPATNSLTFEGPHDQITRRWSWCDALFMGPPAWLRLFRVTNDRRYRDFAVAEWWRTSDYLYDQEEHLYYRDSRYFPQREANGRKIFWSRGNGWVMGGLVRSLQMLPADDADRPRFETQFREMAAAVIKCQQADGLWRSSLLDPDSYPLQETSGSGFFTYALTWGINQGLLDRATYEPVVRKAWEGLVRCVNPDGKLTHVQPIGADPKKFDQQHSDVYGVGAFLLAGSELHRMALLTATASARLTVRNTVDAPRGPATIELPWEDVQARLKGASADLAVMDAATSRLLDRQLVDADGDGQPEQLLFQTDFLPAEPRAFLLLAGLSAASQPAPALSTFGRFVPERKDDYAWENDRMAYRVYGPALQNTPGEVSGSGIDVWLKSTRRRVIDDWYRTGDYHNDHGDGVDAYKVGTTRGCGGLAIEDSSLLLASANFTGWKRLAEGPIRTTVELQYGPWTVAGRQVTEVRRISLDRGAYLNRMESRLTAQPPGELAVAIGLALRPATGAQQAVEKEGWLAYTEPEAAPHGRTHTAVVIPGGLTVGKRDDHWLARRTVRPGEPLIYFAGAGWSKAGFPTPESWQRHVQLFAWQQAHPLEVRWAEAAR